MPEKLNFDFEEEEAGLVHEWRQWNHDYLIGTHLIVSFKSKDSRELGERVLIKCEIEMNKIVKRLQEIRR